MVLTKDDVEEIVKLLLINNQKALQGYVIATLYFKIGEYHSALKYVSKYLYVEPDSFVAYKLQGECYEKLNRSDDALKSYDNALKSVKKKNHPKRTGEIDNVDEIREKMEKIEILPSLAVDVHGSESTTVNNEPMDVMTEVIHTPTSSSTLEAKTNECSETTFDFRVVHITSLDCDDCSDKFVFQNLLWRVIVIPNKDRGVYRTLSVYLMCIGASDTSQWSCHIDAEIRLLSVRPNQYPHVRKTRHLFRNESDAWGVTDFLSWYDAVRPDGYYMQDDCITVQVHLKVLE